MTGVTAMLSRAERHVGGQHVVRDPGQQQDAAQYVDQGKVHGQFDCHGIIGDMAHQVAGFIFGIIAHRQVVQMLEYFLPQGRRRAGRTSSR